MKEYDIKKYLNDLVLVDKCIDDFIEKKVITSSVSISEIKGHVQKAQHNLDFVGKISLDRDFLDWAIVGCYYASYHASLALIMTKNYSSKNHFATLLILIKEFYNRELSREDIDVLSNLLNYQDILFYVDSKNKRENASYSTNMLFSKSDFTKMKVNTSLFVSKVIRIVKENV